MTLPQKAMILAAGLGKRMRAFREDVPKPLVKIAGRALIDRALDRLIEAGIKSVVVNVHHKADMLRAHLETRSDVDIVISDEIDQLLDTGGGVKKALKYLGNDAFITHNSDSIWIEGMGLSLRRLAESWDPDRMDALMLMAPTVSSTGYEGRGDFDMEPNGQLIRREEARVASFVWAGVQIIHPRLFDESPDGPFSTNLLWDKAAEDERLFGMRHDGIWMHVGSPDGVAQAEALLKES